VQPHLPLLAGGDGPTLAGMALTPRRIEPQDVYIQRRAWSCSPNCGCCLLLAVCLLFGCALFTWFALVALGWR